MVSRLGMHFLTILDRLARPDLRDQQVRPGQLVQRPQWQAPPGQRVQQAPRARHLRWLVLRGQPDQLVQLALRQLWLDLPALLDQPDLQVPQVQSLAQRVLQDQLERPAQ